ncbi:peptidase S8/S53 domain-containing protein [Dichotomocladium elegans]|nr:peptidase S8/S53 domain-containing protein [Dichotomocladium elegans]
MGRLRYHSYYLTSLLVVLGLTPFAQSNLAFDLSNSYIVELARPPHECGSLLHQVEVRYEYNSDLFYGASIIAPTPSIANHVLSHPDIVNVWPVRHHSRPYAQEQPRQLVFDPDTPNVIPTLTEDYRPIRSANGSGINIGVIDSGVDYLHPALGGCFGSGCKIAYGYDLVGDDYDGSPGSLRPDDNPLERCPSNERGATGHGTFVSGLISAVDSKYNWTGAAPEAKLGMWRQGTTTTDIFIKAMEMAYEAKMDILSLSFGEHGGWSEDPLSVMADRLVSRGVHVIVASGNIGTSGVMLTASPAAGRNVIAVGSVGNTNLPAFLLSVTHSDTSISYRTNVDQPITSNLTYSLASVSKTFGSPDDGCEQIPRIKGKDTVLLLYGDTSTCSIFVKLSRAEEAGAAAALVYTNSNDTAIPETTNGINITVAFINWNDGKKIFDSISRRDDKQNYGVIFSQKMVALPSPAAIGGRVLSFSSLGPTNELDLKPEIMAVGGDLFSTLPFGGYGIVSGTSMSTPLIAGSIALYLDATGNRQQDPSLVKTMLMNYAQPVSSPITRFVGYGDAPVRQGAGKLNLKRVIDGSTRFHVTPAKLSFNDTEHLIKTHTLTVHNHQADKDLRVNLIHGSAQTVYSYDPSTHVAREPILFATRDNTTASILFSSKKVCVPAGKSAEIEVTIVPPEDAERNAIYGGYIGFRTDDGELSASVPYIGMVGNMSDLPILDRSSSGIYPFPSVGKPDGTIQGEKEVVAYGPGYWPTVLVRLLTGTPELVFELYNAKENKKIGTIPFDPATRFWVPRNTLSPSPSSTVYKLYEWHGDYLPIRDGANNTILDKVHDGAYKVKVRARHVFSTNQWDEWTSPVMQMYTSKPHITAETAKTATKLTVESSFTSIPSAKKHQQLRYSQPGHMPLS